MNNREWAPKQIRGVIAEVLDWQRRRRDEGDDITVNGAFALFILDARAARDEAVEQRRCIIGKSK